MADLKSIDPTQKQDLLTEVMSRSHQYDISYLKTIMMRKEDDPTGLMGLIIGKSQDPDQTVEILTDVGRKTLDYLKQMYGAEQEAFFAMFSGGPADWKNMAIANDLLVYTIGQLKKDGITQSAQDFLVRNERAIKELYGDWDRISHLNNRHKDMHPKLMNAGIPTIIYTEEAPGIIKQQYILPAIPVENVELLQAILPEDTEIPAFMRVINMGGHPLVCTAQKIIEELLNAKKKHVTQMNSQQVQYEVIRELQRRGGFARRGH